jgi:hypothetical protein
MARGEAGQQAPPRRLIAERTGITVNPESLFDVQAKRIHEYKRQHLNVLHILTLYLQLKKTRRRTSRRAPSCSGQGRTGLFHGQADHQADHRHRRSWSTTTPISAGSRSFSSRTSTSRTPAHLSGRRSVRADLDRRPGGQRHGQHEVCPERCAHHRHLDGANVEIREEVGDENFFLFGLTAEEVQQKKTRGYRPRDHYEQNAELREVLDFIASGALAGGDPICSGRLWRTCWHDDPFLVLADYPPTSSARSGSAALWRDPEAWTRRRSSTPPAWASSPPTARSATTAIAWRSYNAFTGDPLELWHTYKPAEMSKRELAKADWQAYVGHEERLMESVRENVTRKIKPGVGDLANRYHPDSPLNPDRFAVNWNRSFVMMPQGVPQGAVVLLHGLTDSPYSMRNVAALYRDRGFAAVGIRLPGHGTVPAGWWA